MRPFNLEEAKAGKKVCTISGKPVRILCFDAENESPIVALIKTDRGKECVYEYTINGKVDTTEKLDHFYDLMMAPEKHEGWINIYFNQINENGEYETPMGVSSGHIYPSKEEAEEKEGLHYKEALITTIHIEWEE